MGRLAPVLRRIVLVALVLVGLAGVVVAFTLVETEDDPNGVTVTDTGPIQRLVPPRDAEILRQEPVGYDLNPGWTGVLQLNGVEIPDDQIDPVGVPIGEIRYTVGDGKAVERFEAGQNCATAIVWRVEQTRDDSRSESWCFNVT